MSMDFGEGLPIDPQTMRGRRWPTLRQFNVFLENKVGALHDLLRHIERWDLKIVALTIVDSVESAVARVMLDNYDRARELFELSEFTVFETDVIGVELPSSQQPYVQVCLALLQAEVNVHYTYPLLFRHKGHAAIAMYVDDIDQGLRTLEEKNLNIITEDDLAEDDDFL